MGQVSDLVSAGYSEAKSFVDALAADSDGTCLYLNRDLAIPISQYGSVGRLLYLGEVAVMLLRCRQMGASEADLVSWDENLTIKVNEEFDFRVDFREE